MLLLNYLNLKLGLFSLVALPAWLDPSTIWHNLLKDGNEPNLFGATLLLIFLVVALLLFAPASAPNIRLAVGLYLFHLLGLVIATQFELADHNIIGGALHVVARLLEAFSFINLSSILIFDVILKRLRFRVPRILRDLMVGISYITLCLVVLSYRGVNITGIVATSAVLTAVIGLSFQDTLGNIMGGLALQMERSIEVGDWIKTDTQFGQVIDIRWRQTTIETTDWDTIIIPNSKLMKGEVTVLGRKTACPVQHRQHITFNIDFRHSPTEVIQAVETALRSAPIPGAAEVPAPGCFLSDYKDSTCQYMVNYWLPDIGGNTPADSEVRVRIYFALNRAGIPLSIPAQKMFMTAQTARRKQSKLDRRLEKRHEVLDHIDIFRGLTPEEKDHLASHLQPAPFKKGELMTQQGSIADQWLYVIEHGSAAVRVEVEESGGPRVSKEVATLKDGDFFGEMSLLTGEARFATIEAIEDTYCYRLDKDSFDEILGQRPELAEDISHLLAKRRMELEAVRDGLKTEIDEQKLHASQRDLLARMRSFFGLGG